MIDVDKCRFIWFIRRGDNVLHSEGVSQYGRVQASGASDDNGIMVNGIGNGSYQKIII